MANAMELTKKTVSAVRCPHDRCRNDQDDQKIHNTKSSESGCPQKSFDRSPFLHFTMQGMPKRGSPMSATQAVPGVMISSAAAQTGGACVTGSSTGTKIPADFSTTFVGWLYVISSST